NGADRGVPRQGGGSECTGRAGPARGQGAPKIDPAIQEETSRRLLRRPRPPVFLSKEDRRLLEDRGGGDAAQHRSHVPNNSHPQEINVPRNNMTAHDGPSPTDKP